jgi:hypothetical protein
MFLVGNYKNADIEVQNLWLLLMAKILPYSGLCTGLEQNIRKQKTTMITSTVLMNSFMGVSDIAFIITVVLAKHEVIRDIHLGGTNGNVTTKKRGRESGKKDVIFYIQDYISFVNCITLRKKEPEAESWYLAISEHIKSTWINNDVSSSNATDTDTSSDANGLQIRESNISKLLEIPVDFSMMTDYTRV